MGFIHDDPEFRDLLLIVSEKHGISVALVEKDYWVTHALWALHQTGLEIWFKGGTSLSKGFSLISRFSEDLDLQIKAGTRTDLPTISNWKSENAGPTKERQDFYSAVAKLTLPGITLQIQRLNDKGRGIDIEGHYPGLHQATLPPTMKPFVLFEIGNARVTPFEERTLTSFVHSYLSETRQLENYDANYPERVRCVHPFVTLLEKLEAITKRHPPTDANAATTFIRHYEDVAQIIRRKSSIPAPAIPIEKIASEMLELRQIRSVPPADHTAFSEQAAADPHLQQAHDVIRPMFWGDRIPLHDCCDNIRSFLKTTPLI